MAVSTFLTDPLHSPLRQHLNMELLLSAVCREEAIGHRTLALTQIRLVPQHYAPRRNSEPLIGCSDLPPPGDELRESSTGVLEGHPRDPNQGLLCPCELDG